mgnify:CR=1 FL=1
MTLCSYCIQLFNCLIIKYSWFYYDIQISTITRAVFVQQYFHLNNHKSVLSHHVYNPMYSDTAVIIIPQELLSTEKPDTVWCRNQVNAVHCFLSSYRAFSNVFFICATICCLKCLSKCYVTVILNYNPFFSSRNICLEKEKLTILLAHALLVLYM